MKRLFLINDTIENKISFYLLSAFLIALPFNHFYSEWLFIVFCLHTLIYVSKSSLSKLKDKKIWIIGSLFFLSASALLFSPYKSEGTKDAMQQIAFFLFPAFLAINNLNIRKYKYKLLELFGITCTAIVLYLFFETFKVMLYFHLPVTSILSTPFLNHNFTSPIDVHPTYFSMYVLLSICIFIYLCSRQGARKHRYIIYCVILFAGLIQLSARAPFLAAEIIFIFAIPVFLLKNKNKIVFSLSAILVSLLFFISVSETQSLRKRYWTDLENDLSYYQDPGDLTESRLMRWDLEWQLISNSPFVGYGSGSEKYILKEKYFENKYYRSFLLGLNAHNQYLSFMLNEGVIGLFLYLSVIIYGFSQAVRGKDFLLACFIIILVVVSFSENILDVSKGVLFYSFFFPLLLFTKNVKGDCPKNNSFGQP